MIEVIDITKRYGATVAVRNLTFTVKPGIVTGFPGPNGAGKSTTMRLVTGPGMIRATFSAVPRRLPVLWGEAMVFGTVAFLFSLPAVFIGFFAGQAILSGQHINIPLSHPGVLRALFGAALYLAVMGLFGLGLGAILTRRRDT